MMTREGTTEASTLVCPRMLSRWFPVKQRVQERIRRKLYPGAINKSSVINIWEELSSTRDFHVLQTLLRSFWTPPIPSVVRESYRQDLNATEGQGNSWDMALSVWNHSVVIW